MAVPVNLLCPTIKARTGRSSPASSGRVPSAWPSTCPSPPTCPRRRKPLSPGPGSTILVIERCIRTVLVSGYSCPTMLEPVLTITLSSRRHYRQQRDLIHGSVALPSQHLRRWNLHHDREHECEWIRCMARRSPPTPKSSLTHPDLLRSSSPTLARL